MIRKILYSPQYGAGWTSWESDYEIRKFMLEYQPIIDYLEAGNDFKNCKPLERMTWDSKGFPKNREAFPECLQQFITDCIEKFDKVPGLGGARDLKVEEVRGPVQIDDFDGKESIQRSYGDWI